jgi:hypothetical protein
MRSFSAVCLSATFENPRTHDGRSFTQIVLTFGHREGVEMRENDMQDEPFTTEEKIAILRRHFLHHVPVADICDEVGIDPAVFAQWKKEVKVWEEGMWRDGDDRSSLRRRPKRA